MREEVALNLPTVSIVTQTTIRSDVPPRVIGTPVVAKEFRQHADDHQVDGADHGDARQHVVEVFRRPCARAGCRE